MEFSKPSTPYISEPLANPKQRAANGVKFSQLMMAALGLNSNTVETFEIHSRDNGEIAVNVQFVIGPEDDFRADSILLSMGNMV